MKNAISAFVAIAALASGAAFGADLPTRKSPPIALPAPVFTWTGPYVGLNVGGGWRDQNSDNGFGAFPAAGANLFLPTGNGANSGGVVGGGQIGFNYQLTPLFVAGVETDFQGTSIGSGSGGGFGFNERITWFGTVRGRIGVTPLDPRLLIYGTGGFAYGEIRQDGFFQRNNTKTGWTAGGGAEWAFHPNLSAKVEYLYTDLESNDGSSLQFFGGERQTRFHTVRAGVNYHFNLFAPTAVVAKY